MEVASIETGRVKRALTEYRNAEKKTVEALLEQCYAMLELKDSCEKARGGSTFSETVKNELELTDSYALKLVKVAENPFFVNDESNTGPWVQCLEFLPPNITTIMKLAQLTGSEIEQCIGEKRITSSTSRSSVESLIKEVRGPRESSTRKKKNTPAQRSSGEAADLNILGNIISPDTEAIAADFLHDECMYAQTLLKIRDEFLGTLPVLTPQNLPEILDNLARFNQQLFHSHVTQNTPKYNKALREQLKSELTLQRTHTDKLIAGEVAISELDIRGMSKKDAKIIQSALHPDKGGNTKAFQIFRSYMKK